jgi:hypothetical protein
MCIVGGESRNPCWTLALSRMLPCAVAQQADVIFLMVPDTPDVEAVLFGAQGITEGLKPGSVVVDMSSISPVATVEFAEGVRSLGGAYLDAPVSGSEVGARAASLSILVGRVRTEPNVAVGMSRRWGNAESWADIPSALVDATLCANGVGRFGARHALP